MVQISFDVLDTPDLDQTNFGPDMDRWLSRIVDDINSNFLLINSLIGVGGVNIGGSGAGPINVPVIGLTPNGSVNANIVSTSNPNISIVSIVPGTNQFAITFNANPGASAIITYQAFSEMPQ